MLRALLEIGRTLLTEPVCPLCATRIHEDQSEPRPCPACVESLGLQISGYKGLHPLPWWAAGMYDGALRSCLLDLKRTHSNRILDALVNSLKPCLPLTDRSWLVPIPSWKRRQGNLLPARMAERLGPVKPDLLRRTQACIGQHHLNRHQRLTNLRGAFHSPASNRSLNVWLVDDILTTGATAVAAQTALTKAGHSVQGLICLARTPIPRSRR